MIALASVVCWVGVIADFIQGDVTFFTLLLAIIGIATGVLVILSYLFPDRREE